MQYLYFIPNFAENLNFKLITFRYMKLYYKYNFLRQFIEVKNLSKKQILEVLGSTDYYTLNQWLSGRVPVHMNGIILLCNHFNIGLENFVVDFDCNVTRSNIAALECDDSVKLQYNNGLLQSFMSENKLIKRDLLEALGSSDYISINTWLKGSTPMHICAILRFCNYYGIPLSDFFLNDGRPLVMSITNDVTAQTTPTEMYGLREGPGRKIVLTYVDNPPITSAPQQKAVEKYHKLYADYSSTDDNASKHFDSYETKKDRVKEQTENEEVLRLKLEHEKELRKMEHEYSEREVAIRKECADMWAAERSGYLSVIEQLKNQLAIATGVRRHLILEKIMRPGLHLQNKDLTPQQKVKLWEIMKRYGASQGFSYDRYFKEGFRQWELTGTDQMKIDFLQEHALEIWPDDEKDESSFKEIANQKGEFYRTIGRVFGLKKTFSEYAMALGMGANSVLNHFSSDDWKDYERIGILAIVEEFEKEISE